MALGKDFVPYADALDEAHQKGLRGIETELVQVPTADNNNVAIVKATAHMLVKDQSPDDFGEPKRFSGLGDASPENVGKTIVPHIIRMAETRAKARALRDAINLKRPIAGDIEDADGGITEEQFNRISELTKRVETLGSVEAFEDKIETGLQSLTENEARVWILKLEQRIPNTGTAV